MSFSKQPRQTRGALPYGAQIAILALLCLLVLLGFVLAPVVTHRSGADATAATPTPQPAPSGFFRLTDQEWDGLTFARVASTSLPVEEEADGTIVPADDTTTQVFSPYTGRVTAVYATVGDVVRAGEPLFTVEGGELAQAENDLAAGLQTLRAARVQLQATSANRTRLLALQSLGGAAIKDAEQSGADLAAAQVAVRNDEIAVALVRSRLHVLGFSDSAVERLARGGPQPTLKARIAVSAPIGGTITQRGVGIGQNIASAAGGSSNALFTITDVSHVFFEAAVSETSIADIHVGDAMRVRMSAFPSRAFDARVKYVGQIVDPNTHRIFVRAEIADTDGALKPGMFGVMTITTGAPTTTVAVPEDAVIYEEDTARVWLAGPGKTLALRYLRTGKTVGGLVQALTGLIPGDRVVVSGAVFIDRALRGGS